MKRDIFVFAGQSNMVGAGVYAPVSNVSLKNSFEYKHKPKRLGASVGEFTSEVYPAGEFSYIDLEKAYSSDMTDDKGRSKLTDYTPNTYFSTSMSNLDSDKDKTVLPFSTFSESNARFGATLAPFLCEEWEKLGGSALYAHIAKGATPIHYYFTDEMIKDYNDRISEYNKENSTEYAYLPLKRELCGADYFAEKCKDFFCDAAKEFPDDDLSNKCFFWLQGEAEAAKNDVIEYETKLEILWENVKKLGFTHFFCIRIDYFGHPGIYRVMKAQENFASKHDDVYMLTRVASYFTFPNQDESGWFINPPSEEHKNCRDSFYGFKNDHINEKGFRVIADHAVKNLYNVLVLRKAPILEEENILPLLDL